MTAQEIDSECPVVSGGDMGWQWPAEGLDTWSMAVHARHLLEEVTVFFITSTIVWSQVRQQGGNTAPPINSQLH